MDPDEDTEPPTRKLEDDIDGHEADEAASGSHQANEPSHGDHSSIISRDESHLGDRSSIISLSRNDSNPDPDFALQKMRIGQLKKLRKEMRKLEKLDKIRLQRAEHEGQGQKRQTLTEIELLKQIMVLSDDSSVSTVATGRSSISALASLSVAKPSSPSNYRGIEGQSASGSDNKKSSFNKTPPAAASGGSAIGAMQPLLPSPASSQPQPQQPPFDLRTLVSDQTKIKQQHQPDRGGKRKPSVSTVKEFCRPGQATSASAASEKDGKTNTYGSLRPSAAGVASVLDKKAPSMLSSSNGKTNVSTDFGQTFPTPRELNVAASTTATEAEKVEAEKRFPSEKKAHRSNNQVNNTTAAASVKNRKPHRSPLSYYFPLPKKHSLIKDARRSHSTQQDNNKENKAPNRPVNLAAEAAASEATKLIAEQPLSLQEALQQKRPEFLQRSQLRVQVLEQIREHRLIHAEKYKMWLNEVSKLPNAEARLARLAPPTLPKMPRLFSYREMVTQAREKYKRLPEIVYSKAEAKRKTSYKTNRLKADMYKKKLQRKVLQGRVSLAHHNQILADL